MLDHIGREIIFLLENIKVANQTQQYSQKTNIKFLKWEENKKENLRDDLVKILKLTVDLDINPDDILAIHRTPGGDQRGPRPVIAKFKNTETKVKVIRKRQDEQLKKHFSMYDHLTPQDIFLNLCRRPLVY